MTTHIADVMNFSLFESVLGRQRCRQWTPLFSQQVQILSSHLCSTLIITFLFKLRLRHLYQIMGYNLTSDKQGSFYYTLHLTPMCAPFYTSEKVYSLHPKWVELAIKGLPNLSLTGKIKMFIFWSFFNWQA